MAALELSPRIEADFERILDHVRGYGTLEAAQLMAHILEAIDVLRNHPFIGQRTYANFRELVIGKRSQGYVALYAYIPEFDLVLVLAIRSQREAGYSRD